ncbi:MAG: ABC transporter ATP-binding protein [Lentisphaeria bacterium]|jgi:iron complex transport system ATP-binding protein
MSRFSIEAQEVACSYPGGPEILAGFNLALDEGEFAAIIGPNGAGKSTVFRVLSGYLRPSRGTVLVGGAVVARLSPAARAALLAVVPQGVFTPMPYSVRELVEMGRIARLPRFAPPGPADRAAVARALAEMDVARYADTPFNHLSGGEKQRVMVAMALAQEPRVLLLDEPTSQLDIGHAAHLMELLETLNRAAGLTILLITHDIQLAARNCRRLILMGQGRILADGAPAETLTAERVEAAYRWPALVHPAPDGGGPLVAPRRRPADAQGRQGQGRE